MSALQMWIDSDDAVPVFSASNGFGRGDGYDVAAYRSAASGRVFVVINEVGSGWTSLYVCPTEQDARGIVAAGYTPGSGPGRGVYIRRPSLVREVREVRAATQNAQ
jgi:hypothetical protein